MQIFWIDVKIALPDDKWHANWPEFSKLITSGLSDYDAMMIEIVGEHRLISCLLVDRNFWNVIQLF